MASSLNADDLSVALEVSDAAAQRALDYFRVGSPATRKADGSPVTEADAAVERLLREHLTSASPGDAFLGEELGGLGSSRRLWILDPIDGTSYFARGEPHWRVQLALQVDGTIEVAVVTAPALGLQWWAGRGCGAFEAEWPRSGTGRPLRVSTTALIEDSVLDAPNRRSRDRLPEHLAVAGLSTKGWCAGLVALVRGELDGFLAECCQIWDHAPWTLLVEEAGGRFTNTAGGPTPDIGGGLYSNEHLHEALLEMFGYRQ